MNKAKIIAELEKRRKPVPYLVAAPDYSRTVYDRDFLTAPVF